MQPHQQRVIDQAAELDERLGDLVSFLPTPLCLSLPFDERSMLSRQAQVMAEYSAILHERIAKFS